MKKSPVMARRAARADQTLPHHLKSTDVPV
jgi:hypothetical protein